MVAPAGQHLDGDYEGAGSEHIVFRAGGCEPCAAPGDPLGPAAHFADSRGCGEAAAQRQAVDRGGEYRNGTDPEFVHAATGGREDYGRDPGEVRPRAEREGVTGEGRALRTPNLHGCESKGVAGGGIRKWLKTKRGRNAFR